MKYLPAALLVVLVLLVLLGVSQAVAPGPSSDGRNAVPVALMEPSYACDGAYATLSFAWQAPADAPAAPFWLDLAPSDHFAEESTATAGPLGRDATAHDWQGVVANVVYHYRAAIDRGEREVIAAGMIHPRCEYLADLPCGDILVPLNKQHRLAADCVPPDLRTLPSDFALGQQTLRQAAAQAVVDMLTQAAANGHLLTVASSYRSYAQQETLFSSYVERSGVEQAERFSARPGHSEHQLGTAADVTSGSVSFGLSRELAQTPEGRWLAENAWRFGFVVSYPESLEEVTGYVFEPWHVRYVGVEIARYVMESGLTLNEALLLRWYG